MRFFNTLEMKFLLIGFKEELPYTTFNPVMPSLIHVMVSWLPLFCRRTMVVFPTDSVSTSSRRLLREGQLLGQSHWLLAGLSCLSCHSKGKCGSSYFPRISIWKSRKCDKILSLLTFFHSKVHTDLFETKDDYCFSSQGPLCHLHKCAPSPDV